MYYLLLRYEEVSVITVTRGCAFCQLKTDGLSGSWWISGFHLGYLHIISIYCDKYSPPVVTYLVYSMKVYNLWSLVVVVAFGINGNYQQLSSIKAFDYWAGTVALVALSTVSVLWPWILSALYEWLKPWKNLVSEYKVLTVCTKRTSENFTLHHSWLSLKYISAVFLLYFMRLVFVA